MIRKIFLTALIVLFTSVIFGQKIRKESGVYVNEKGEKYTGTYISYYQDDAKNQCTL